MSEMMEASARQVRQHLTGCRFTCGRGGTTWSSVSVPYRVATASTVRTGTAGTISTASSGTAIHSAESASRPRVSAQSRAANRTRRRSACVGSTTSAPGGMATLVKSNPDVKAVKGVRSRDVRTPIVPRDSAPSTTETGCSRGIRVRPNRRASVAKVVTRRHTRESETRVARRLSISASTAVVVPISGPTGMVRRMRWSMALDVATRMTHSTTTRDASRATSGTTTGTGIGDIVLGGES